MTTKRKTPTEATDWELGNELLHRVIDALSDSASNLTEKHPDIANRLLYFRSEIIPMYRDLVGEEKALL